MATKRKPAPARKAAAPAPARRTTRPATPAAPKLAPVVEPDGSPVPSVPDVELAPVVEPTA